MRVLLLSDWMSNRGGAESYIVSLRDSLREAGDETCIISCGASPSESDNVDVRAFGSDRSVAQAFLQIANPLADKTVRNAVREFRPDVALVGQFAYHFSPSVLKALSPVPTVVSIMDYKTICPLGTKLLPGGSVCTVQAGRVCRDNGCVGSIHWMRDQTRYRRIRERLSSVSRVLCPSEGVRRELATSGIDATTVPLGVRPPAASFRRAPTRAPTFAYCGRLSREKGVAVLIAAFAKCVAEVPAARLRIVGDGPLKGELVALAAVLGISRSVDFAGWQNASGVDDALAYVWALVAPSLWAEPFGLIAIEAMLRGVPVVASDSGGFRETIHADEDGLRFLPGNVAALTDRLVSIARRKVFPNHRLDDEIVNRVAETYSMEKHVTRMRQVFSEVTAA